MWPDESLCDSLELGVPYSILKYIVHDILGHYNIYVNAHSEFH